MAGGDRGAGLALFRTGLAAAALCALITGQAIAGPMVRVDGGALTGSAADGVVAFKAIPYAAPPTGDLRWRPPAGPAAWSGARDATAYGPDCPQNRPSWDPTQSKLPTSEDCLTLNVWTPNASDETHRPVMVWIHGGGFTMGSGSQPIFDGTALAQRGLVVVTFNYRLGRFGFFAHPALTREAAGGPVGNYALMDQIAALRWVRRNIAAFGGDPGNVTIFGESAGGGSVELLLLAKDARGLFQKAISQSGGGRDDWPALGADRPGKPSAEHIGEAFAKAAGASGDDAAALRAIPMAKVLGKLDLLHGEADTYSGPMMDGRLITTNPADGFLAGRQARVPLLIGANSNELGFIPAIFLGAINAEAIRRLGPDLARVVEAYGAKSEFDARIASDQNFVEPARTLAGAMAAAGTPTFLYSFGYVPSAKRATQKGAPHASELAFVFGNLSELRLATTPEDAREARLVGDYWTRFARTGDPNGAGRPTWPAYHRRDDLRLVFNGGGAGAENSPAAPLDALAAHYAAPTPR